MTYFILSTLLAASIAYIATMTKRNKNIKTEYENKQKQEIAAIKENHKAYQEIAATKLKTAVEELQEEHETKLQRIKEEFEEMRKNYRNRGEIITHDLLGVLKKDFIKKELLKPDEMIIMPNIFIPDIYGKTRQIDHLVLLPQGLYLIETKYWKGHIVLGMAQGNCGTKFSFLPKLLDSDKEQTLVFDKEGNSIKVQNYGNPLNQAKQTAGILKNYLNKKFGFEGWTNALVFFNYEEKEVHTFSKPDKVDIIQNKDELYNFFRNEITKKNKKYSVQQLNEIQFNLENANYI